MNSTSEREPSSGENSTSSAYWRAGAAAAPARPLSASRVGFSLRPLWVLAGVRDRGPGLALYVLARGLQLALDVDIAGGDEGVDAGALGVLDRVPGRVDVLHRRACEPADDRPLDLAGDRLNRLEVTRRG